MPHATLPSPALQALILCGPGISLNTFTSKPSDLPKALIPLANRPMVWYPLDWCYRMGITDITLITAPEALPPLQAALATHPALTSLPNPKPDILAPKDLELNTGTAELLKLKEVQDQITTDFVILPCDLVSEVEGSRLLQQWMAFNTNHGAARSKGGLAVYYPTHGREGISNKKDETDFIATVPISHPVVPPPHGSLRSQIEEVVLAMPTDTLNDIMNENKQTLPVRHALLRKHGRAKLKTKHRDAHVYFFPRWVKDFVARNETFESIGEDVVGWWAKAGWQEGLAEKLGLNEVLGDGKILKNGVEDGNGGEADDEEVDAMALSSTTSAASTAQANTALSFASRVGDLSISSKNRVVVPPLLAYIQPSPPPAVGTSSSTTTSTPATATATQSLIRRIDTAPQLAALTLYLARQSPTHPYAHDHQIHPSAQIGMQTRISQEDCLIAENVTMGIRCNIKESVVGAGCEIGANVRLMKCVLMDGVVVGDGVTMTGCIVGRRARIEGVRADGAAEPASSTTAQSTENAAVGKASKKQNAGGGEEDEKTRLTDCEVAPYFVVGRGTEAKGETLKGFADDDDDDDVDDEDEGLVEDGEGADIGDEDDN
ncbi:hypothetical protein LTR62_005549 [Meristemomyces frigidus]|uniref:Translation initiation factor eIF2B subunit gamma n=1 Tax=Meristemomyces frigidus TaxID=1508187 RepID=A0AAN7YQR9_9PEZI|nr:hypothetical protein LTR62_005549 [Meristemomyces frigidus]